MTDAEPLMTVSDLVRYLQISKWSVYRMVEAKTIPHTRVGERIRFRKSEIDAYLERNANR